MAAECLIAQAPISNEDRLKAAFVYQFAQFVEWPARVWEGTDRVELCVLSPNRFGRELAQLVRGEALRGRPLVIRDVDASDSVASCQVLFVTAQSDRAASALKEAAALPILTIGEADGFLNDGGVIVLKLVDRRVRFDVNVTSARRVGIRISAQLLALAQTVRGGPS